MEIALLYFDGCPHWKVAQERLATIATERPDLTMTRHLVETFEEAERVGFHGSPSILVDGVDPFARPGMGVGLACRVYETPDGPAGAPTLEQLRAAVAHASTTPRSRDRSPDTRARARDRSTPDSYGTRDD